MPDSADTITLTFPSSIIAEVIALSDRLLDRMHYLLERNTGGTLSPIEREELNTLVRMAGFSEVLSTALRSSTR
jgi:hypothetical protein